MISNFGIPNHFGFFGIPLPNGIEIKTVIPKIIFNTVSPSPGIRSIKPKG
jgi:hypothetical protein